MSNATRICLMVRSLHFTNTTYAYGNTFDSNLPAKGGKLISRTNGFTRLCQNLPHLINFILSSCKCDLNIVIVVDLVIDSTHSSVQIIQVYT